MAARDGGGLSKADGAAASMGADLTPVRAAARSPPATQRAARRSRPRPARRERRAHAIDLCAAEALASRAVPRHGTPAIPEGLCSAPRPPSAATQYLALRPAPQPHRRQAEQRPIAGDLRCQVYRGGGLRPQRMYTAQHPQCNPPEQRLAHLSVRVDQRIRKVPRDLLRRSAILIRSDARQVESAHHVRHVALRAIPKRVVFGTRGRRAAASDS